MNTRKTTNKKGKTAPVNDNPAMTRRQLFNRTGKKGLAIVLGLTFA